MKQTNQSIAEVIKEMAQHTICGTMEILQINHQTPLLQLQQVAHELALVDTQMVVVHKQQQTLILQKLCFIKVH